MAVLGAVVISITTLGRRGGYSGSMRSLMLARRRLLRTGAAVAGLGVLAGCGLPLRPEQSAPGGTSRHLIGVLGDSPSPRWDAFRAGLRELGWIEGQNLAVEHRWIEGNSERYRALTD